jgi:AcrR family transcriptional regulator
MSNVKIRIFFKPIDRRIILLYHNNEQRFIIVQVLKEEVRRKIKKAALYKFEQNGYQKTSMRSVALSAGVTVGNLYRYFKNKDDIFNVIIQPAFQEIYKFIDEFARFKNTALTEKKQKVNFIKTFEESLIRIYIHHRSELVILLNGSKGSQMENAREQIISLIAGRIRKEAFPRMEKKRIMAEDNFLAQVLAASFIEGISLVLYKYKDKERTKELFTQFSHIYFRNLLNELI